MGNFFVRTFFNTRIVDIPELSRGLIIRFKTNRYMKYHSALAFSRLLDSSMRIAALICARNLVCEVCAPPAHYRSGRKVKIEKCGMWIGIDISARLEISRTRICCRALGFGCPVRAGFSARHF